MTVGMAPRLSLLGKFVVLSLLATVLLAVAIGSVLHERIERRALDNAEQLTRVIGDLTIAPRLTETQLEGDLRRADPRLARRGRSPGSRPARAPSATSTSSRPTAAAIYSDDRAKIEPRRLQPATSTTRSRAPRARRSSGRSDDDGDEAEETTLEVYMPLRLTDERADRGGARGLHGLRADRRGHPRGLPRALPAARPRPRRCSGSRSSRSSAAPRASSASRRPATRSPGCRTARACTTACAAPPAPRAPAASSPRCC